MAPPPPPCSLTDWYVVALVAGLNQLLWYYADMEKKKCTVAPPASGALPDPDACVVWRRFAK